LLNTGLRNQSNKEERAVKRERRLVRIIAIVVLGLLIALPAITGAARSTDTVTIKFAICVPDEGKWRVMGTAAPGNTVTVTMGKSVIGTSAPATPNGRWKVFVKDSAVVAGNGDSIKATSNGGGTATQAVLIR
jgi:hypothetical protein